MSKPKRVVSIGEYVRHVCRYYAKTSIGTLLCTVGGIGIGCSVFVIPNVLLRYLSGEREGCILYYPSACQTSIRITYCGIFLAVMRCLIRGGNACVQSADEMEPVVPLTRATVDQIPAEDVLVRSSSEPTLPESVLLRAATPGEGTEIGKDLLRASLSGEDKR